jgi:ATP-dependent Lon protease
LEEDEYPHYYHKTLIEHSGGEDALGASEERITFENASPVNMSDTASLKEQHLTYQENQRGISFEALLGPYLKGATRITITDPYIRLFYQIRNLMELLEAIARTKPKEEEITVHLITVEDDLRGDQQKEHLEKIKESSSTVGITFTWELDRSNSIHARHIVTDHGWKILLDRGLDIFQHYEMNDCFTFANRLQQFRACKAFEVTFLRSEA